MRDFRIRIGGDGLGFHASHFIVWGDGVCERLHGHGYRIAAEVRGPLNTDGCVLDFHLVRGMLEKIAAELDQRVLLPTRHPRIGVSTRPDEVEVAFADRRWVFPASDCLLLPISNTTAELLAGYVGERLCGVLGSLDGSPRFAVRIEIDECAGCSAVCELST